MADAMLAEVTTALRVVARLRTEHAPVDCAVPRQHHGAPHQHCAMCGMAYGFPCPTIRLVNDVAAQVADDLSHDPHQHCEGQGVNCDQ